MTKSAYVWLRTFVVAVLLMAGLGLPGQSFAEDSVAPVSHIARVDVLQKGTLMALSAKGTRETETVLPFAASHVVVEWQGRESIKPAIRLMQEEKWSNAIRVDVDHDTSIAARDGWFRSSVIPVSGSSKIRMISSPHIQRLRIVALDVDASMIPIRKVSTRAVSSAPAIISRQEWGANESLRRGKPAFAPVFRFIVHHTDTALNDPNPSATVRAIYTYHVLGNGWSDIGYNYLVDQQGRIYEGRYSRDYKGATPTSDNIRGEGVIGAHAQGSNTGAIGISLLGTYSTVAPAKSTLNSLATLLAWQGTRNGVRLSSSTVGGHRDFGSTDCPGGRTYALLPKIISQAAKQQGPIAVNDKGYWLSSQEGRVTAFGNVALPGDMSNAKLKSPIVRMTPTPSKRGYWMLGANGSVFALGDAKSFKAAKVKRLRAAKGLQSPVVSLASTKTGDGYWLVTADGQVLPYGDAESYGSMSGISFTKPIVDIAATPTGKGYWLVSADGGVFSFGDATFRGSMSSIGFAATIVRVTPHPTGGGYWLLAKDGGVFSFGAPFYGSAAGKASRKRPIVGMRVNQAGTGYWILRSDGVVYSYGKAVYLGGLSKTRVADLAVAAL